MMGLKMVKEFEVRNLKIFTDSQFIISLVRGQFEAKDSMMARYLQNIKKLSKNFKESEMLQIPRSKNTQTDALSHLTTLNFFNLNQKVLIEQLDRPSIKVLSIFQIDNEPS